MALLEKIRQRKKILAIVIGGALLAFIVEVAFEALGRQAGNSTVAKVGSEKIDIQAFQDRVQKVSDMEQQRGQQGNVDQAARQQEVLEQMIQEKLLEQEYEKVGIKVTDSEITELMTGKNAAPQAMQFAQQCGAATPAELNKALNDPKNASTPEAKEQIRQIRLQWDMLRDDIVAQYKAFKLQTLVNGCIQANALDRAAMAEDQSNVSYITYVKKDYSTLADDKYPVSDAEIKAEWEKTKKLFAIEEETRAISFIAVPVVASDADKAEAKKIADKAYAALQQGRGIEAVRTMGAVKYDTAKVEVSAVPANLKDFVSANAAGAVKRDSMGESQGVYKFFKLIAKTQSLDSVQASFVAVPGDKGAQDKALAMLKEGKTGADVAKAFKDAQSQDDQWIRIANYPEDMKKTIENAGAEYVVYDQNDKGAVFIKVTEKKPAKTYVTFATVDYEAYASTATSDKLHGDLQNFINKNKTADDIVKNAKAAGYQVSEAYVTPSTPQLSAGYMGIKDTRKAIKWAFEAKKGNVSPIFTDNNDVLIVVAVNDIYDDDFAPCTDKQIKEGLELQVRNDKKGEALMKQHNGKAKDLNGYAKLLGVKVDTCEVMFGNDNVPQLGEIGIIGRIAAAKQGQFVGLWKGKTGVFAFQVNKVEKSQRKMSDAELNARYQQVFGRIDFIGALRKATKVKKDLISFF